MTNRWDETWHRLREWTNGQAPSERLASQILSHDGFTNVDPSHPLGGRDGGKDGLCFKDEFIWAIAAYFPRGQKKFNEICKKFRSDLSKVSSENYKAFAFVTNQELTLAERQSLKGINKSIAVEIYHLERITGILDQPAMNSVRKQFLNIESAATPTNLGGHGGTAPGSGGGGGGAIGPNAQGGRGGPGGNIRYEGGSGNDFGAGGGGGGAVGEDAVGGDGGGGGELVYGSLKLINGNHLQYRVGKGGEGGAPGEDSIVHVVNSDGEVLNSIVAKAGEAGQPAPVGWGKFAGATHVEIDNGFCVSSIFFGDFFSIRNDGLIYAIAAGWEHIQYSTSTFSAQWPLVFALELSKLDHSITYGCKVCVKDPDDFLVLQIPFGVRRQFDGIVSRPSFTFLLQFTGSKAGVWRAVIESGNHVLGALALEVRLPPVKT